MTNATEIAEHNKRTFHFFYTAKSPFSQWHACVFKDEAGRVFRSAEQYMMFNKATLFGDEMRAKAIMSATNQMQIKALGRAVTGFDERKWAANRERIVIEGNLLKFTQNPRLQSALLDTVPKMLVEASPKDRIWGIGLDESRAILVRDDQWPGTNLLGKCLVVVRSTILRKMVESNR
jgi:ribA/ribD-fused uncharacterized protein